MPNVDVSRVRNLLLSLYQSVQTLDEFTDSIVSREGPKTALLQQPDTNRFVSFVQGVFVCADKPLQDVPSYNQICLLPELLAFVLNNMKRKKKRNVLANGYGSLPLAQEERHADQFKFRGDITLSAAYIHGSDLWEKIAQRLGTDIMRYLLESCAIFVSVPPSCAFQVCGIPVYDRVSLAKPSIFQLQNRPRRNACSVNATKRLCRGSMGANLRKCVGAAYCRRREDCGRKENRKREREPNEGEEAFHLPRKKRRLQIENPSDGLLNSCEVVDDAEQQRPPAETDIHNPEEDAAEGTRPPVKITPLPMEDGPSWRSGTFPPLPPSQCFIRTLGMLYGGKGMCTFLLNRKRRARAERPRRQKGRDLVRIVFFEGLTYLSGVDRKPSKLPRRFFNMIPLFSELLHRHRKCPYKRILQWVCPAVTVEGAGEGRRDMGSLLPQHVAPHRVFLFLRECLSTVVPQQLWGSDRNRFKFLARIRSFLCMGKLERLSLAELMWKMRVNDCDWLKISKTDRCPPSELSYRTRLLGQFLAWMLDGYVVGLVRACFYVTESMGQKNALRFYRHEVWAKLQELAFRGHLSKGQVKELTPAQVTSLPKDTVVSRLRFIPKADSMRPITRIIGVNPKTKRFKMGVRDLLDALRVCVRSRPSLLGSSVWGMTDIHRILCSLVPAQREVPKPLYFVKVDLSGAFESLPHGKLLEVIDQVLSPVQQDSFSVRCYAKVWANSYEGLKKSFVRQADLLENYMASTNMKAFVVSLQKNRKVHDAILVEQRFSTDLSAKGALEFFIQMLTESVVQYGKRTFRQSRGIPQGSVVSSLLCCLCYGHMENLLFNGLKKKGCLMRLVDDFLLITPELHQAQAFLKTLLAGVPEYGCVVNPQKVAVNFPVTGDEGPCPVMRLLPAHCLFPWCGLLLDTRTLDVYSDYSSYAGLSLRYSLTLGSSPSAGQQMRRKLLGILRLKCHALFLDLKCNSLEAVYKNIYKLVLLHACRFHVCAQSLPFGQKVDRNPNYFLELIWDMAAYANRLIRLSNKGVRLGSKAQTGVLQYEAVDLLFCLSFLVVLSRHRNLYRALLPPLHAWKRSLERRLGDLRLARVRQASSPRTPEEFMTIPF